MWSTLSFAIVAIAMSGAASGSSIMYDFRVDATSGVLSGDTASGSFTFDSGTANIRASDQNMAGVIATYLASNPSLQLGIDGTMNPLNPNLSAQRVSAVRAALAQAGVPDAMIQGGAVNDPQYPHDGRVEILISTR